MEFQEHHKLQRNWKVSIRSVIKNLIILRLNQDTYDNDPLLFSHYILSYKKWQVYYSILDFATEESAKSSSSKKGLLAKFINDISHKQTMKTKLLQKDPKYIDKAILYYYEYIYYSPFYQLHIKQKGNTRKEHQISLDQLDLNHMIDKQ